MSESEDIFDPQNSSHMYRLNFTVRGTKCPAPDVKGCNEDCCPVNCKSEPIPNPKCSKKCGGGRKQNYIITQHQECNGTACEGNEWEDCNTQACDCEVQWQGWSACSEDCGPGTKTMTYIITQNATPGGKVCPEDLKEACNKGDCVSVAGLVVGGQFLKSKIISHLFFLSGFVVLLVFVGGVGTYNFFKIRKQNAGPVPIDHIVFEKNEKLKETIHTMAEDTTELFREFRKLEQKVRDKVQGSTANSQKDINKKHNRYIDIGQLNIHNKYILYFFISIFSPV